MNIRHVLRIAAVAGASAAIVVVVVAQGDAQHDGGSAGQMVAQATVVTPCPSATNLPSLPEIHSDPNTKRLKATLRVVDGLRTLWDSATPPNQPAGTGRCARQYMRYFTGHTGLNVSAPDDPAFAGPDPISGPTLRARVGDWVEIAFLNEIDTKHFGKSLDRGDVRVPQSGVGHGHPAAAATPGSEGCDVTTQRNGGKSSSSNGDVFPDCIHGSSTANVHFHGTHTTPSTTGDNVLLMVRPALRQNDAIIEPIAKRVQTGILDVLGDCERTRAVPTRYANVPASWKNAEKMALAYYDQHTAYFGSPPPLPMQARLSPVNDMQIAAGLWPQYSVGGTPYCFPLPDYDTGRFVMGQAPGTHWYHAHKHGSTALNVANGMVGALIVEGKYDDELRAFYRSKPSWQFSDAVLVIQQLATALNKTAPGGGPGSRAVPVLSVNGRRSPVIVLRPNQVRLFRFINGAERDGASFQGFAPALPPGSQGPQQLCSAQRTTPCVHWAQTAQDGVQFAPQNYDPDNAGGSGYQGRAQDRPFYLAPANRADLLVQAPSQPGRYDLLVVGGVCRQPQPATCGKSQGERLLTVSVEGPPIADPMPFAPPETLRRSFPRFLGDIPESDVKVRRTLTFQDLAVSGLLTTRPGSGLLINGKQFNDHTVDESMLLGSVEEWTIRNTDTDKEHPFHIHINPFQIVEVFEPNSPSCKGDMTNPSSFDQCIVKVPAPFVWWDTFAIPSGRQQDVTQACNNGPVTSCPKPIQPYTQCGKSANQGNPPLCVEFIPGYFKMRTRFVDYTGQYVLHCHILTHEDRGMMQLIEVVPNTTPYTHH